MEATNITVIAMHPGWVKTDMGGPDGLLTPEESVSMMHKVISNLSLEDSGKYLTYENRELQW